MEQPLIIKIGGSLMPYSEVIIRTILETHRTALILPGGGIFADAVRDTKVDGTKAHWMAIAGMEQYGWLLSGYGAETTDSPEFSDQVRILLPYQYLRRIDPLPHSWEITSDTISAWFANELKADLLILKSIDNIRAEGIPIDQIITPIITNDLDPAFIPYILTHNLTGSIINGTNPDRIRDILQGSMVTGTFFGTMI